MFFHVSREMIKKWTCHPRVCGLWWVPSHLWVLKEPADMVAGPLSGLWEVMAVRIGATVLEESKYHPGLQRRKEGELREPQANLSHFISWKDNETFHPGGCLHTQRWWRVVSMLNKPDCPLCWDLGGWEGGAVGIYLEKGFWPSLWCCSRRQAQEVWDGCVDRGVPVLTATSLSTHPARISWAWTAHLWGL